MQQAGMSHVNLPSFDHWPLPLRSAYRAGLSLAFSVELVFRELSAIQDQPHLPPGRQSPLGQGDDFSQTALHRDEHQSMSAGAGYRSVAYLSLIHI